MKISASLLSDAGIDSRLLDCWEVTLAMALLGDGHRDVRSVLGSQWWFASGSGVTTAPRLDFEPAEDRLMALTGLRMRTTEIAAGELASGCREALDAGHTPMVVTDGYLLPWCPYAGNKHVEHSFVVTEAGISPGWLRVVDAYDNQTEWGAARPLETMADPAVTASLEEAGTRIVTLVPEREAEPLDRRSLFQRNLTVLAGWVATDPYRAFIESSCHAGVNVVAFDEFCQACWTVERRRGLYGGWLDDLATEPGSTIPAGLADRFRTEIVTRWSEVNRFTYLALRRLRAGRGAPGGVADLVAAAAAAERDLATELVAEFAGPGVRV